MKNLPFRLRYSSLAIALVAAGCGGSATVANNPASGSIHFSPSPTLSDSTSTSTTEPATGGTTITTASGATAVIPSGALPAGTTIPAGTELAVLPAGVGFQGSFGGTPELGVNTTTDTGANIGSDGTLAEAVALPVFPGSTGTLYTLTFPQGDLDTTPAKVRPFTLTIQNTAFVGKYYVLTNPTRVVSPVPTNLAGRIPNNGQNAAGSLVQAAFGPGNSGRTATLHIDYGNGFALTQTKLITNNQVTFANLREDSSNVPSTGIRLLQLTIGDLP